MSFKIEVENDFQQKIMVQKIIAPATLDSPQDVQMWRQQWMEALKSWHSPYKCMIDASELTFVSMESISALEQMKRFFDGFFLKKSVVFGLKDPPGNFPFEHVQTQSEAESQLGIRVAKQKSAFSDFRSVIQIQNHFAQHTLEVSFGEKVQLNSREQLEILKSKIINNLMQWHSKWNLLIDVTNLDFDTAMSDDFKKILKYFSSFFMKAVVGYGSNQKDLPFTVYRSRHKAVAGLEAEGFFVGNEAHCKTKK